MSTNTALPLVPDTPTVGPAGTIPALPAAVSPEAPEQLSLLEQPALPLQFRLDQRTRERGLAHIAAIKAQLAARAAARSGQEAPHAEAARPELGARRKAA